MRQQLHLSVPQPCAEHWSRMSYVDENKRHCASCKKVITDFTQMSDEQLLAHFKNNPSSCGMFAPHQLNRQLQSPKKKQTGWLKALVIPALLALTEADAQEAKPVAVTEQPADSVKPHFAVPLDDVFLTLKDTLIVRGKLVEVDDSLKEYPVAGALLLFHTGDSTVNTCVADADGNFQIKLAHKKPGDTVKVEVKRAGYDPYITTLVLKEEEIIIQPSTVKTEHVTVMGGAVTTITTASKTREFFRKSIDPRSWLWYRETTR